MEDFGTTSTSNPLQPSTDVEKQVQEEKELAVAGSGKLILDEERETGAVSWHVYHSYAKAMGSMWWAVAFGLFLSLTQAAQIFNSLFLGFWTGSDISSFDNNDYMAVYACEPVHSVWKDFC